MKTTCGGAKTPFFITRNEKVLSDERPEAFRLYRVFEFARAPVHARGAAGAGASAGCGDLAGEVG